MRVFLPLHGFVRWNGGLDLVRLLTSALAHVSADRHIQITFGLPAPSAPTRLLLTSLRQWREFASGNRSTAGGGDEAALLRLAGEITRDHRVIQCRDNRNGVLAGAREAEADVIFPTMLPLGRGKTPRVGYIFDFQHRYLPDLFSPQTRRNRDRRFARIAQDSDGIVVNSRVAAADANRFLGVSPNRILTMPFAPYALPFWFDVAPEEAQRRYGISGRYLLVCNHFWKHKDHATALRALALLRQDPATADLQLVLTGDPIDHRDPAHYGRLLAFAKSSGLEECTHFLGLIPKRDQLALMRGCAAVLQPTHFEGGPGGGAVYEAIGLGVPTVVSDIPVNREIDQGDVLFFGTGDHADLARITAQTLAAAPLRPSRDALLARADTSLDRLGNAIADFLGSYAAGRVTL